MKIVYFVNQYPAITHTFIKREILALERRGFEIIRIAVRCGRDLVDITDRNEARATVYLLDNRLYLVKAILLALVRKPRALFRAICTTGKLIGSGGRSIVRHSAYLAEACAVAHITLAKGGEHIHAHFGTNPAAVALLASTIAEVPFSFTVHGYDEFDRPESLGLDLKSSGAVFVACVSSYGRSQMLRWCAPGSESKIALVRCGLEKEWAQAQSKPPSGTKFVCVARLRREKAQWFLVEAIAKLRKSGKVCELVLVGDGDGRGAVELAINRHGVSDSVRLVGWKDGDHVRDEILSARALVVPSFAENLPVVIMEAMALGRPVVATTIAGVPELVIPGENGWLAPAGDVEALCAALAQCLETPDDVLAAMGAAGRRRVLQRHDANIEAGSLASLFVANSGSSALSEETIVETTEAEIGETTWRNSGERSPTYLKA